MSKASPPGAPAAARKVSKPSPPASQAVGGRTPSLEVEPVVADTQVDDVRATRGGHAVVAGAGAHRVDLRRDSLRVAREDGVAARAALEGVSTCAERGRRRRSHPSPRWCRRRRCRRPASTSSTSDLTPNGATQIRSSPPRAVDHACAGGDDHVAALGAGERRLPSRRWVAASPRQVSAAAGGRCGGRQEGQAQQRCSGQCRRTTHGVPRGVVSGQRKSMSSMSVSVPSLTTGPSCDGSPGEEVVLLVAIDDDGAVAAGDVGDLHAVHAAAEVVVEGEHVAQVAARAGRRPSRGSSSASAAMSRIVSRVDLLPPSSPGSPP